jgi:hypothetical protein
LLARLRQQPERDWLAASLLAVAGQLDLPIVLLIGFLGGPAIAFHPQIACIAQSRWGQSNIITARNAYKTFGKSGHRAAH